MKKKLLKNKNIWLNTLQHKFFSLLVRNELIYTRYGCMKNWQFNHKNLSNFFCSMIFLVFKILHQNFNFVFSLIYSFSPVRTLHCLKSIKVNETKTQPAPQVSPHLFKFIKTSSRVNTTNIKKNIIIVNLKLSELLKLSDIIFWQMGQKIFPFFLEFIIFINYLKMK